MQTYYKHTFSLFSTCVPVQGYSRSIIYDLNRSTFYYVPNSLVEVLVKLRTCNLHTLQKEYNTNDWIIIKEYLKFLQTNELGFYLKLEDIKKFPKLDLKWDFPEIITNIIVELSNFNTHFLTIINKNIELLGCSALEIRITGRMKISEIFEILSLYETSIVQTIDIFILNNSFLMSDIIKLKTNNRIREIIIFNYSENLRNENIFFFKKNPFTTRKTNKYFFFTINVPFFTEAQTLNTYFNRKIFISNNGNIKNSPETNKVFGNIFKDDITKVVSEQEFQKIWNTPKSKIEQCSICEYRFMCIDNRVPLIKLTNNKSTQFYFNSECEYNPIEMKWKDGYGKINH